MNYIKKTINLKINNQVFAKVKIFYYFYHYELMGKVINLIRTNNLEYLTYFSNIFVINILF